MIEKGLKLTNLSSSMYIGHTTGGVPSPVFFDTHTPIFNNKPPGTVITGAPGSGKTFFALTLTTMSRMLGKTTIVLDPKGDFISLVNLKDELGDFNLWDLSDDRQKGGLLDPFYMAEDKSDKLNLAVNVIDIFVGGLRDEELTVLSPVIKDVIDDPNPSLTKVVEELRGSRRQVARDLGAKLNLLKDLKSSKLCFAPAPKNRRAVNIDKGLTVITLAGLNLPKTPEEAKENSGRLITGLLYLLTDFIRRVMDNSKNVSPKTLIIDEAWVLLSTPHGARVIESTALLGRSKGLSLVLITQNNSHLENLKIDNTISTRFAFRSDRKEAKDIVKDMGLPENENYEDVIVDLSNGECLMHDWMGRYSRVQISLWKKDWKEAFDTNPLKNLTGG